nr:MAG TPA: CHAP domain protein [Caudoviricetes sp.]
MATNPNADNYAARRLGTFFPGSSNGTMDDGDLTGQCVSLVKWFGAEMCGLPNPGAARGNAKDFGNTLVNQGLAYEVSPNQRQQGDLVVWPLDGGGYGHIGVLLSGDRVFEQNVALPGSSTRVVAGNTVYSSRIDPLYVNWRRGGARFYRMRNYVGNRPAVSDDQIKQAYREVLEREADEGGINHYRQQAAKGWNIDQIRSDLMNSNERKQLEANKAQAAQAAAAQKDAEITSAIKQAYRDILERDADDGGIAHYKSQIAKGWTLDQVRQDLLTSNEHLQLMKNKQAEAERRALEAEARREVAEKARAAEEKAKAEQEAKNKAKEAEDARKRAEEEAEAKKKAEEEAKKANNAGQSSKNQSLTQEDKKMTEKPAPSAGFTKEQLESLQSTTSDIAEAVAGSEDAQNIVKSIPQSVKVGVYITGDLLILLGMVVSKLVIAFSIPFTAAQTDALGSALIIAGTFMLVMFGLYKSGRKK